jgi:hypothetical protein
MRSRRERLVLFHSFDCVFSRNTLWIPGNALRESLLDIFREILEDLIVRVDPFDLLRIPVKCVSSDYTRSLYALLLLIFLQDSIAPILC